MKNIISLFICLFCLAQTNSAQVNVIYNPSGEKLVEIAKHQKLKNSYSLPEKLLPQLNLDSIKSENERKMDLGGPFIYGHQLNVNFSTTNSGKWEEQDNLAIWRLKVKSTGAFSLSFHFNKFFLPENAQLIIYNEGPRCRAIASRGLQYIYMI